MEIDCELVIPDDISQTTMNYKCVIAFGIAEEVADFAEKSRILHLLLRRYTDSKETLPARAIENTGVLKVTVNEMTGKGNF